MTLPTSEVKGTEKSIFRVEFVHTGIQQPVFIAGSFADPPWQLMKMDSIEHSVPGENKYSIKLSVQKGIDYQYKFRIGEGDWWVLNEDEPTVIDDAGNRNNLLQTSLDQGSWKDIINTNQGCEACKEERQLTKYTAEERRKGTAESGSTHHQMAFSPPEDGSDKQDINQLQGDESLQSRIHDTSAKFSEKKDVVISSLIPENPVEPTPTPAICDEKTFEASANYFKPSSDKETLGLKKTMAEPPHNIATKTEDDQKPHESSLTPENQNFSSSPKSKLIETSVKTTKQRFTPAAIDQVYLAQNYPTDLDDIIPIEDQVPRLPHEIPFFSDENRPKRRSSRSGSLFEPRLPRQESPSENSSPIHTPIEIIPADRASIVRLLEDIQRRLPEDETHVDKILDPSEFSESSTPSAKSPVLQSITEEAEEKSESAEPNDKTEEFLKLVNVDDTSLDEAGIAECCKCEPEGLSTAKSALKLENEDTSEQNEDQETLTRESHGMNDGTNDSQEMADQVPLLPKVIPQEEQTSKSITNATSSHPTISLPPDSMIDNTSTNATMKNSKEQSKLEDNRQNALKFKHADEATTSGFSDGSLNQPNPRKILNRQDLQSTERPITPNSMRPASKEAPGGNFLKVFWRVIIIEWIGGMIMRFCGRGGRRT